MEAAAYSEKYVLFLDILGFSEKVIQADSDLEARGEVKKVLEIIKDTLCDNPNSGHIFTYFSDCIVVSSNRSLEGLREITTSIRWLTFNLLNRGYFVRGGLTVGLIYHDKEFVFGLPLIAAHKLESEESIYPRTILSETVLEDLRSYGQEYLSLFRVDSDGKYFLDYLMDYREYSNEIVWAGKMILDRSANNIINHTQKKLNAYKNRPLEKIIWLKRLQRGEFLDELKKE
jgi:hypothetical protein